MQIKPLKTFRVTPRLPEPLAGLLDLAYNLRWSWDAETRALFRRIDRGLWETTGRNPVAMLGQVEQSRLTELVVDSGFMAHYERVLSSLREYLAETETAYQRLRTEQNGLMVAYFSAEFGITDCIPIYSGGLGVLAGDHLKAGSDFGLPLVGVGLLYQYGYFRQRLNADGWQQEVRVDNDFHTMPIRPVTAADGAPLVLRVPVENREVAVKVWVAEVGRVPLYLLDTNLQENPQADRDITDQLYAGERDLRIRQEIVLGVGGVMALEALGIQPNVFHMNEGHTAFLAIERIRRLVQGQKLAFHEAVEVVRAGNVFTTHTPVPAGNEYFAPELVDRCFQHLYGGLGIGRDEFLGLGRVNRHDDREAFCMTVLALRLSARANGVSGLHGTVSREMWAGLWPGAPPVEIPIGHVTNGVHAASWMSDEMRFLLDSYWGPDWHTGYHRPHSRNHSLEVPLEELWRAHERRRERLVAFVRQRLARQMSEKGATLQELSQVDGVLDPEALTIGFARRFTAYKRPYLLLKNQERLAALVGNARRPVQFIVSGKAHPLDETGKNLIRDLVHLARRPEFRKAIVFVEDYDVDVARFMVQGVDVWLNTPRRPLEASGTSGMKAAMNGALNLSVRDGWWDEAYEPGIGWALGGEVYDNEEQQDQIESDALFDLLEKDVVPLFYERGQDRFPVRWADWMRRSMQALCPRFHTHRMVEEYAAQYYVPAHHRAERLLAAEYAGARRLGAWKRRVAEQWGQVAIEGVSSEAENVHLTVGDTLQITARVRLGELSPDDVSVQLCLGRVDPHDGLAEPVISEMQAVQNSPQGWQYRATSAACCASGLHGYTVRVLPHHPDLDSPWELGLVRWAV